MLDFNASFSAKEPYNEWLFWENDLQLGEPRQERHNVQGGEET